MKESTGLDARDGDPRVSAAVEELRALLRSFDDVEPDLMDERFYAHAYNELDLAGRAIIDAFDREGRSTGDCTHE
ncbi:hypothetical protein [Knoellia subterranea]|uniref:Uncharacterized protein n=1 Tax=Knoellia subterranea KCTC 19937 TaxID=1385521 RepID=A0A0A0JNJ7_9MICO|nr:hypothetical protein [Knoellia subterranea]KGN37612.1 hypothetical protein N803_14465 [Knoellia subterranea KCTC 19937]